MIELYPRRPPQPTEKNQSQRGGRRNDLQRTLVILQLEEDPERPYLRGSDIAATAWMKGSQEYRRQSKIFRDSTIRNHLAGNPDNVDENKQLLKTEGGKDQDEAYSVRSIQDSLTYEMFQKGSDIINNICDRNENYAREGRTNIHYYFLNEEQVVIERDLDREAPPEFPPSHIPEGDSVKIENTESELWGRRIESNKGSLKGLRNKKPQRRRPFILSLACILLFFTLPKNQINKRKVSDEIADTALAVYMQNHITFIAPNIPFIEWNELVNSAPIEIIGVKPEMLAATNNHPSFKKYYNNELTSPP